MSKQRIDLLLVARGLVASRALAQRLVMAGQVRVNQQVMTKPAIKVDPTAELEIVQGPRFVSRGGDKLAKALDVFPVEVAEKICADVGASTGGFTDCLLQNKAAKVYAIDVGYGILDWKLRTHPAVVVLERTNARYLETLPEKVALITIDVSFISIKRLLPVLYNWLINPGGEVVALIKPQFEAGRAVVSRGRGVIRDPRVHKEVLLDVLGSAQEHAFYSHALIRSPLIGPKGNVEFLTWLRTFPPASLTIDEQIGHLDHPPHD